VLLLVAGIFFFYPRQTTSVRSNNGIDTVSTCKCGGFPVQYGEYCFGLLHSCTTSQRPNGFDWTL
jgi:hypothetical protein